MSGIQPFRQTEQALATLTLIGALASSVQAQTTAQAQADPNPGNMTLTGSVDAVSHYMFRAIRQPSTGIAFWPVADLGVAVYTGDGTRKRAGVNVGTWNSLHEGDTGADGPTGKRWYESFEFDTSLGVGQADGGSKAGRYLELGVAPGYAGSRASLTVPVKVGVSLADYYELNTGTAGAPVFVDNKFGYFSVAGLVMMPLGGTTSFGAWNLHGGVEFQALGDTPEAFNGGDGHKVIVSGGFGFSY